MAPRTGRKNILRPFDKANIVTRRIRDITAEIDVIHDTARQKGTNAHVNFSEREIDVARFAHLTGDGRSLLRISEMFLDKTGEYVSPTSVCVVLARIRKKLER